MYNAYAFLIKRKEVIGYILLMLVTLRKLIGKEIKKEKRVKFIFVNI